MYQTEQRTLMTGCNLVSNMSPNNHPRICNNWKSEMSLLELTLKIVFNCIQSNKKSLTDTQAWKIKSESNKVGINDGA